MRLRDLRRNTHRLLFGGDNGYGIGNGEIENYGDGITSDAPSTNVATREIMDTAV